MACEILKIGLQIKILTPKNNLEKGFAIGSENVSKGRHYFPRNFFFFFFNFNN